MNAATQRRLTPALACTALVLGGLLLVLLAGAGRGVHWHAPRPADPLPPLNTGTHLPPPHPLPDYAEVWEQPLFSPDRKPVVHAADGGGSLGDMQLTGIIITPGLHMALLYDKQGKREVRVREGSALPDGGWTLVELKPRSVVFDNAGNRSELSLPAGAPIDRLPPGPGQDDHPVVGAAVIQRQAPGGGAPAADAEALRAERIRLLKAAVEKRRNEQNASQPPQGVR